MHEHFVQVRDALNEDQGPGKEEPPVQARDDFAASLSSVISLDTSQPLISMPGSKKRKRSDTVDRFGTIVTKDDNEEEIHKTSKLEHPSKKQKNNKSNNHNQKYPTSRGKNSKQNQKGDKHQRGGKHNFNSKRGRGGRSSNFQNEAAMHPYDYSRVDYSEFRGGGRTVGHKQVETKHRGKVRHLFKCFISNIF